MRHPGATGPVQGPPQSNQEEAGVGDGFSLLLSEGMVVVYANSLKPSPIASLAPSRLPQSWWAGSSCLEEGAYSAAAAISIDSGWGNIMYSLLDVNTFQITFVRND